MAIRKGRYLTIAILAMAIISGVHTAWAQDNFSGLHQQPS